MKNQYIRWFEGLGNDDVALVGGKNASLGELYRQLTAQGVKVPNGFAISAGAYRHVLESAAIEDALHETLAGLDPDDPTDLARGGRVCRELVYGAGIPADLREEILAAFETLRAQYGEELKVAVRSSATAEDLPTASFAGQHDTYLNVGGGEALIDACRRCFASLFTDRAIRYRVDQGFDHMKVLLSVGVMKMVRADLAASGVIFTLDTESGFRDVVYITGAYGLGENVVQGAVDPDEFYVHKPTFRAGRRVPLRCVLGEKKIKMVCGARRGGHPVHNVATPRSHRRRYCIDESEVLKLAEYAIAIEEHYGERAGQARPMDIEWAKDGLDGELYVVQARPETVASQKRGDVLLTYELKGEAQLLCKGRAVSEMIAAGKVRIIEHAADLGAFREGEVLVADTTSPDWGTVMRRASALVTNRGGRTCHAAIVARELGIPAVVGCADATECLQTGEEVTVSCAQGETGRIYAGRLPFEKYETDLSALPRPNTQIMVNLGNPELAFRVAMMPNDGVGLARMEFIISEYVKVHPMALAHPGRLTDDAVRERIGELTHGHSSPTDYFVRTLSEGVGTIAAAFYPKPVVVRLSDFKTNEYADLIGGRDFEPCEANPMLGFRGASRYAHPAYRDGFALECAAMKRVRDEMGLTNVKLMIPFCRRLDEARRVLDTMAEFGLRRGENGLEIYCMCEIPNNVLLIDEFAELFDGFSIGSNDLTQLTLGVDRDSEIVAFDFDERDPGMLKMLELAVEGARRNGKHSGICGQAPSDYPEVAEFLVRHGIDSISLNPDALLKTMVEIARLEQALAPDTAMEAS